MAYNEDLVNRVRECLVDCLNVEEKYMFGGICFMVDAKMCVGVVKNELMCRLNPSLVEDLLNEPACRPMDFTGKSMKGFVFVEEEACRSKKALEKWVQLCLDYNPLAKASTKKSGGKK
jgi:TfoX/Sxy family transcriptional regulator of competence genes